MRGDHIGDIYTAIQQLADFEIVVFEACSCLVIVILLGEYEVVTSNVNIVSTADSKVDFLALADGDVERLLVVLRKC